MPSFKLDGREIPFEPGDSIIKAAAREGVEIPHYCWHAGLSAPANCRMCLVEIKPAEGQRPVMLDILEWDAQANQYRSTRKPKLQPSCQMAATENQEVLSDSSPHVLQARSDVQERLLLNHPVDCPICDQAGECKLQDYWLEHQRTQKRMHEEPVHKPKGVVFGDTIVYDAERCVMCTRCVRFMDEVAKDPVLEMRERGNLNEITVAPGRKLEGNYTFMTEHVCPVGALTTKDFRFKARVWFLKTAKSICQGCATGCNSFLDYDPRNNKAYRYRPRDNMAVNQYWMCDQGMLSYRAAHEGRVTEASVKGKPATVPQALENAKGLLSVALSSPEKLAVVLSAESSLEDNYALYALGRALGAHSFLVAKKADGPGDDILLSTDKNSNVRGVLQILKAGGVAEPVQEIGAESGPAAGWHGKVEDGSLTHVLSLGSTAELPVGAVLGRTTLVAIAAHHGHLTEQATVVLPATSWAEHSGIYVNKNDIHQRADRALFPQGSSKPAWKLVLDLAHALGVSLTFSTLADLRRELGEDPLPIPAAPADTAHTASLPVVP